MHEQYKNLYEEIVGKMDKSINTFMIELSAIRAGRANPAVLEHVRVDYYGASTPINQIASVSSPEPRALIIQPWDATALKDIEKAIMKSDIGIQPTNDGKLIRLSFPPLTEERRKDLVKTVHKDAENAKVAVRNIRRDSIEHFKALKKKSEITEDDLKDIEKDIQELTDKYVVKIDDLVKAKEKEILEV